MMSVSPGVNPAPAAASLAADTASDETINEENPWPATIVI
jgi:hypothetical protein